MNDETPDNKLQAQPAILEMTIQITRKATGIVDTYTLTSDPIPLADAQRIAQPKEV